MNTAIDIESEPTNAIALRPSAPPALFGTTEPIEIVSKATAVADSLKSVIKKQGLISNIQGKEYPRCEAWTLLGTMLGVFPVCVWTKQVDQGWEARVEARTRDGSILGAAEAQCLKTERNWNNRDDFALRSMAQTRATAKALRMPLGFVMTLAGFEATPSEEMEAIHTPSKTVSPQFKAQTPVQSVKTPPKGNSGSIHAHVAATKEQRDKMIALIEAEGPDAVQKALGYFIEVGALLPNETLKDLPLYWVPTMASQMRILGVLIAKLNDTGKAEKPAWVKLDHKPAVETNPAIAFNAEEDEQNPFNEPEQPKIIPQQPELKPQEGFKEPEQESWYDVIVPVPRRGQKRDEYLKSPDTIGSLFDARHDDEEARRRLFGFAHNFEPKPWTGKDGKQRPPSKSDIDFRQGLDDFCDYYEKNHEGEQFD